MPIRGQFMREIAGVEIDKIFPGLAVPARQELVTSVVRQWLTNDGWAGLFTVPVSYWLHLKVHPSKKRRAMAGVLAQPSEMRKHLTSWSILEEDLPGVLHQLSISQSAVFINRQGLSVRVSAEPKDKIVRFEEVKDE